MQKKGSIYPGLVFLFLLVTGGQTLSQDHYADSIGSYRKKYVKNHEVVKGDDKKDMHFFPVDKAYRIPARFKKVSQSPWFNMPTSSGALKEYRVYGILHFTLHDTALQLNVYQSRSLMNIREYADHLFIPFTDKTSGEESYENGRYIDLDMADLASVNYVLDFNAAYNPYCAYISGRYSCPIPPKENDLPVAIRAGEMKFGKVH